MSQVARVLPQWPFPLGRLRSEHGRSCQLARRINEPNVLSPTALSSTEGFRQDANLQLSAVIQLDQNQADDQYVAHPRKNATIPANRYQRRCLPRVRGNADGQWVLAPHAANAQNGSAERQTFCNTRHAQEFQKETQKDGSCDCFEGRRKDQTLRVATDG